MNQTPVNLDQNFRSHRPIIDWVNHLFGEWMGASESQAEYVRPATQMGRPTQAMTVCHPVGLVAWRCPFESPEWEKSGHLSARE